MSTDSQSAPGVVELREDVPLKGTASASSRCCGGGPRFILACFAALSAGITIALLTQIYYGDYEVVPHGSVSSSAAACSRAGTDALKSGGRAIDAAAATALCLAVLAPHRTSLDASGSLIYWEYRTSHTEPPKLVEWGGPEPTNVTTAERPPRMVAALAFLHAKFGALPWSRVLQPAVDLARTGFVVSEGLSAAESEMKGVPEAPGTIRKVPLLADYLEKLQMNTSAELSSSWSTEMKTQAPHETSTGTWKLYAGGAGAAVAGSALAAGLEHPMPDADTAFNKVVFALQQASLHGEWPPNSVSTGLAVVDRFDTYVALVTGLSKAFGSGLPAQAPGGWELDEPLELLDLAPAIIVHDHVCGTRYVVGAESSNALAQGAAALLTAGIGAGAVERPRVAVYPGGTLAIEATRDPPAGIPVGQPAMLVNATLPYAAVNVVQQTGDALISHADSRGGGLASRF